MVIRTGVKVTLRAAILLGLIVLLSGCVGVEIEIRFNSDGSGTMTMKMTVSKAILEAGDDAGVGELGIPLSKEDLEKDFEGAKGVRVVGVTEEETDENMIISAVIEFDDFEALMQADESALESAAYKKVGGKTIFTMNVGEDKSESAQGDGALGELDMDDAMVEMMQAFLEGYFLEYRVVAPTPILSNSHGELGADGQSVSLRLPMGEYFTIKEPYTLKVEW